jgi:opacity protein-like surface antigen
MERFSRKHQNIGFVLAAALIGSSVAGQSALASTSESAAIAALQKTVATLEARVAVLEAQAQQRSAQQADQLDGTTPRPLLVSLTTSADFTPMRLGRASQVSEPVEQSGWSGLYWGAAFGYGMALSSSRYRTVNQSRFEDRSSSADVDDEGAVSTNSSISVDTNSSVISGRSDGTGTEEGALVDLYLGANTNLTPRIVAGIQVEGGLANMRFRSRVNGEQQSSSGISTSTSDSTSANFNFHSTDVSRSSDSSTDSFPQANEVRLDWTVSVLGRAGWLATPSTLVYGLAGWTYGHFEEGNLLFGNGRIDDFGSHGLTVGGGIEKKLSPKWSLRAEYRYTNFGTEHFSTQTRSTGTSSGSDSDSSSSTDTFNGETFVSHSSGSGSDRSTNSFTETSRGAIENDMHVGRIGITRYFSTGD